MSEPGDGGGARAALRVLFVNRYYFPDVSATAQLLTDLAEALAQAGMQVGVLSSRQLYEDARAALPASELVRGVRICRLRGTAYGRGRLLGRAIDYLSFYWAAAAALRRHARDYDVVVLETDPPLLSILGWLVAPRRVARVNWLQDLFPEVAARLSPAAWPRALEAPLSRLRDRSLEAAAANVVLGERMREHLIGRGADPARVVICENWSDEAAVRPRPATDSALRRRLGLGERFVVGYSGNLGRAHDVTTLLAAAEALRTDTDTVFLMIGGGAGMRELEASARTRGLTQLRFLAYQPRAELADSLAAADVHLVTLKPQLEGLIVPSKVYGILAAGRPVVFVGDPDGELARLIRTARVGISVASGDGAGLAGALRTLRAAAAERGQMGQRGRALLEQRYTLAAAVQRWRELLERVALANPHSRTMQRGGGPVRASSHS